MDADLLWRRGGGVVGSILKPAGPPTVITREPLPPAPRQARSAERRRKLLEAGRDLFGRNGFEKTSVGQIASRAGAASGAFYIYFRSKRQLLVTLMNELLERLNRVKLAPSTGSDMQASLAAFLAAIFKTDLKYFGVIRAWQEAALTDPELAAMQEAVHTWTEGRVLGVFKALQQHPAARRDSDLPAFARMMDRHFWSLLARGSSLKEKELGREIDTAAAVIYHYLFRDAAGGPASRQP